MSKNPSKARLFGVLAVLFGTMLSIPSPVEAKRRGLQICGVDVSRSYRCWLQLKKLKKSCPENPTVCSIPASKLGDFSADEIKEKCKRLFVKNRKKWISSLCGVKLFSPPGTYCGEKGVEVAIACAASAVEKKAEEQKDADITAKKEQNENGQKVDLNNSESSQKTDTVLQKNEKSLPSLKSNSESPRAPEKTESFEKNREDSRLGTVAVLLIALLASITLIFFLRRRYNEKFDQLERNYAKEPSRESKEWSLGSGIYKALDTKEYINHLENKIQKVERELAKQNNPARELQNLGDLMREYYLNLAKQISMASVESSSANRVQKRLLQALDRIDWIFKAHRELPGSGERYIAKLRGELKEYLNELLSSMGYFTNTERELAQIIREGEFSAEEFFQGKARDQAYRILKGEELQKFDAIRAEYLERLETLYKNNLKKVIEKVKKQATPQLSALDQQQIFMEKYILELLLDVIPNKMLSYLSTSSAERASALAHQLFSFILGELDKAGIELFPEIPPGEEFSSLWSAFKYLTQAGVRLKAQPSVILREPTPELAEKLSGWEKSEGFFTEKELSPSEFIDLPPPSPIDSESLEVVETLENKETETELKAPPSERIEANSKDGKISKISSSDPESDEGEGDPPLLFSDLQLLPPLSESPHKKSNSKETRHPDKTEEYNAIE